MSAEIQTPVRLKANVETAFEVLAWEIELAGARCIFLDTLIGEMMATVAPEKRERVTQGMHAVDLLAQHLTSLSAFSRRLGAVAPIRGEVALTAPPIRRFSLSQVKVRAPAASLVALPLAS